MYETSGPYALDADPPVWRQYREVFARAGLSLELNPMDKWDFYPAVNTTDLALTIQTGDQQRFANLLLTIGIRVD